MRLVSIQPFNAISAASGVSLAAGCQHDFGPQCILRLQSRPIAIDWVCRIVLKSNCDTPIDVWLVSGHHQHQQKVDDEVAFGNPHAAVPAVQVKHESDGLAGP